MQKKNDNLIDSLNYNIVSIQINKKRKIARCKSFGFNCEQCNVKCLANKNNPLTIEDLVKARNQARAAAKNVATQVAENKLQEKEQLKAQLAAEIKAKREAEEKAKREAEEKAKREAEEKAKREAEEKAKREAEEKAKREAEEKAKREAEEKAKREAEEKAKREAEEKAKREAEEKAKREAEEKAKREAEEKAKREAEEKAAAEKAAAEKAAAEKAAAEKAAAEKAAAEKAAAEKAAAEKAAAEKAAAEKAAAEKAAAEKAAAEKAQEETAAEEQPAEPAPEQEKGFKLTLPAYMGEVLPRMATKRARKLIYTPKEVVFETSCKIETAGKKNDEGIKIKNILDAEIKEGLKLGYLEKYDGLKTSEIKEEYENDTVYEIAEQEFKKSGLLADGDKVKLFIYDWTGGGIHHVGYLPDDKAAEVMPFLNDMDKYSFDICSIITGGKSKTIKKDPETGKFTITKNKDGDYGIELDITIINRKD